MKMYSAKRLGDHLGMTAQEVNRKLTDLGLQEGTPGNWKITEKGQEYASTTFHKTNNGQGCVKGYDVVTWAGSVLNILGNAKAHMKNVDKNRKAFGFKPIDWENT